MHKHGNARKQAHEYEARIVKEKLFERYEITEKEDWIYGKR